MGLVERNRAKKEFDRRRGLEEEVEACRRLAKRHGKPWAPLRATLNAHSDTQSASRRSETHGHSAWSRSCDTSVAFIAPA